MAANLLLTTITKLGSNIPLTPLSYALNKNRMSKLDSLNSGADTSFNYLKTEKVNQIIPIVSSDNYSTVFSNIDGANQYSAGNKFQADVTRFGSVNYPVATNVTLSTDNIVWVYANPSDASKSIILYEDPSQGEISVYVNNTVANIIVATTS